MISYRNLVTNKSLLSVDSLPCCCYLFKGKMSSNPILYYTFDLSPPSRAVVLTAKALHIDLDLRNINLMKGEQLTSEFLKVCVFVLY